MCRFRVPTTLFSLLLVFYFLNKYYLNKYQKCIKSILSQPIITGESSDKSFSILVFVRRLRIGVLIINICFFTNNCDNYWGILIDELTMTFNLNAHNVLLIFTKPCKYNNENQTANPTLFIQIWRCSFSLHQCLTLMKILLSLVQETTILGEP